MHLNQAWSWKPKLWPTQLCIQIIITRYEKINHKIIYMFHTKNHNYKINNFDSYFNDSFVMSVNELGVYLAEFWT